MFLEPTESLVSYDSYGDKATLKRIDVCKTSDPVFGEWAFPQISRKLPRYFSGNSQKRLLNVTSNFIKFLENPSKNLLFLS